MQLQTAKQPGEKKLQARKGAPAVAITSTATHTSQPVSPCEDLHKLIAKRAYELHAERGYRHSSALDDWLEAEREILSQIPPV
jgi:hypothetical protein